MCYFSHKDNGKGVIQPLKYVLVGTIYGRSNLNLFGHCWGDVDIVVGITKLGEQVAGNTKLE
jgi:hypothetical protein